MSNDADELHLSRTPSLLRLWATVPLSCGAVAGLLALLPAFGVPVDVKVGDLGREAAERVIVSVLAVVALAFGMVGVFMFSRWETVIDRRRGTVIRRWNLLGWQRADSWPLDRVTHVELRFEERIRRHVVTYEGGKREEPHNRHFVVLCGDDIGIPVAEPLSEIVARRDAERVAAFLGLELHNRVLPFR